MKLTETETIKMDLVQEELDCIKQEDEEFWGGVRELLRYGIPSHDKQGHCVDFRCKVRPLQMDIISAIAEKMPPGWFKNQAYLKRSIIAVGCKVILRMIDMEKGEWHEILDGLNDIAKRVRMEEFKKDMATLKSNIIDCGTMPPQEQVKVVNLLARLEKKFLAV